jgi:tetratricopeptide (TPR) repeat protein
MGKRAAFIGVILLTLAAVAGLKVMLDGATRAKIPGAGIVYLPSGPAVKAATFGYSALMADIAYVWAIQYYGNTNIPDRFTNFNRIFDVIADLDPKWIDPYLTAALIAHYDMSDAELALKMFDNGAARNPGQWIFPLEAGHYCQMNLKDFERAKAYYKKAMEIPGAPDITKRLFANSAFKAMDYQTSWAGSLRDGDRSGDQKNRLQPSLPGQGGRRYRRAEIRPRPVPRNARPGRPDA